MSFIFACIKVKNLWFILHVCNFLVKDGFRGKICAENLFKSFRWGLFSVSLVTKNQFVTCFLWLHVLTSNSTNHKFFIFFFSVAILEVKDSVQFMTSVYRVHFPLLVFLHSNHLCTLFLALEISLKVWTSPIAYNYSNVCFFCLWCCFHSNVIDIWADQSRDSTAQFDIFFAGCYQSVLIRQIISESFHCFHRISLRLLLWCHRTSLDSYIKEWIKSLTARRFHLIKRIHSSPLHRLLNSLRPYIRSVVLYSFLLRQLWLLRFIFRFRFGTE